MKSHSLTIRKIIRCLNNRYENGGVWLPNIQRHFVWSEDQIEKLFDSIMREYPIGTLMIWKTDKPIKYRRFTESFKKNMNILNTYEVVNQNPKMLVLDGQQRLQSMYIALLGSYEGKDLYIDILNSGENNNDDVKYKFKFLQKEKVTPGWIKVKDIVFSTKKSIALAREIFKKLELADIEGNEENIEDIIGQIDYVFCKQELITYEELDSIDNKELYSENDIVEIFIRANSGGTILEKSDLLLSLLTVSIDSIEESLEELLYELNLSGYKFTKDFVLKTFLTLIGVGSKYEVDKFRKNENIELISKNWDDISNAIKDVKDFISGGTYLRCDKTLTAYNPLIPIIYLRYKYRDKYEEIKKKGLSTWILKVLITGVFSGSADSLIDLTIKEIERHGDMDFESLNNIFRSKNKNLTISKEIILSAGYFNDNSKKKLYLLFNLIYENFNLTPIFEDNKPNIDHIFPQSKLKEIKVKGEKRMVQKYKKDDINQIGNCMLLTQKENQMGGKGDKTPEEWFKDKDKEYLEMHLIPEDKELWKIENYEEFIKERNKLILNKVFSILND
ncbi:DUF262 domain-containing protein [Clostridium perfringens]|nr:DUF262 domain-containing protein [Clostridium perfringens]